VLYRCANAEAREQPPGKSWKLNRSNPALPAEAPKLLSQDCRFLAGRRPCPVVAVVLACAKSRFEPSHEHAWLQVPTPGEAPAFASDEIENVTLFSASTTVALQLVTRIGDDRVVPNCYYVTSSSPQETAKDVAECVRDVGGPGELRKVATDGRNVYSLVYYGERDDADRYLNPITRCLRAKGHEVHRAEVLEDVEDFPGFDA
jgi:hypothetical protein